MHPRVLGLLVCVTLLNAGCGSDEDTASANATGSATGGAGAGGDAAAAGGSGAQAGGGGSTTGAGGMLAHEGIAAKYPGDVGIDSDAAVIFADGFEGYAQPSELTNKWDSAIHMEHIRIATEAQNVFYGNKALEFTVPQQDEELSNGVDKVLSEERDLLFLRYYSKFQPPFDVVGSSHNGSTISAHYFIDGQATPGVPADGTNKFLAALENWRGEVETASPGLLNVYLYHPEQRSQWGDHFFPTGTVMPYTSEPFDFGPEFVSRPDIIPELDHWYCYELMLKANTPGMRDGRITVWFEGQVAADFTNLRLRDIDSLKIDRFGLSFHIFSNPGGETRKWYDNVVAATSYIGPLVPR